MLQLGGDFRFHFPRVGGWFDGGFVWVAAHLPAAPVFLFSH